MESDCRDIKNELSSTVDGNKICFDSLAFKEG